MGSGGVRALRAVAFGAVVVAIGVATVDREAAIALAAVLAASATLAARRLHPGSDPRMWRAARVATVAFALAWIAYLAGSVATVEGLPVGVGASALVVGYVATLLWLRQVIRLHVGDATSVATLDALVVFAGVTAVVVDLRVGPTAPTRRALIEQTAHVAFPLVIVVAVGLVVMMVACGLHRTASAWLFVVAAVAALVSDVGFSLGGTTGSPWMEIGWLSTYLALTLAVVHPSMAHIVTPPATPVRRSSLTSLSLVSLAIVGVVVVLVRGVASGVADPRATAIVVIVLALVATRLGQLLRERERVVAELDERGRVLSDALSEIEQKDAWRARLVGSLAHDVRAPLSVITGALASLRELGAQMAPGQVEALAEAASRQAERLERLATGLLDLARFESGRLELDLRPVDVDELARAVVEAHPGTASVALPRTAGVLVRADRDRLEQVLFNLLSNAVEHGAPPVAIAAALRDGQVEISVSDQGPGIDPEPGPDWLPTRGYGLTFVDAMVAAQGGQLVYERADGRTRFRVILPVAELRPPDVERST